MTLTEMVIILQQSWMPSEKAVESMPILKGGRLSSKPISERLSVSTAMMLRHKTPLISMQLCDQPGDG